MATRESMVIYESAYKAINYLPDVESKWEAIEGLIKYGFYGEEPESDNPFINMIYVQAIPSMRNAKDRYDKAVENGKKGGRPSDIKDEDIIKLKSEGKTNKEIAEMFGVTDKAIEKRVTNIRKNNPTNPTNLSVSVSVSDSVSDSVSVSDARVEREEREIEDLELEEKKELYRLYKLNDRENYGYLALKKMFKLKSALNADVFKELKDDITREENKKRAADTSWMNNVVAFNSEAAEYNTKTEEPVSDKLAELW